MKHCTCRTLVLLIMAAICGCSRNCGNIIVQAAPAPDGAVIAFVFDRRCAADDAVSTHVSIVPYERSLANDGGNVLVVDGDQSVHVTWNGPKSLVVSGFKDPQFMRKEPIDSVSISFQ